MSDEEIGKIKFVRQTDSWGNETVSPAIVVGSPDPDVYPWAEGHDILEFLVFEKSGALTAHDTDKGEDGSFGWYETYDEAGPVVEVDHHTGPVDQTTQIATLQSQVNQLIKLLGNATPAEPAPGVTTGETPTQQPDPDEPFVATEPATV